LMDGREASFSTVNGTRFPSSLINLPFVQDDKNKIDSTMN
jgi:hypothetical protein